MSLRQGLRELLCLLEFKTELYDIELQIILKVKSTTVISDKR